MNRKARKSGDALDLRFARDLIDVAVFSKTGIAFLGVVPAFTMAFIYAQILQDTPAIAVSLMLGSAVALLVAAILLYMYRFTFRLEGILATYGSAAGAGGESRDELEDYTRRNLEGHLRAGRYGLIALVHGAAFAVGATTVAGSPDLWTSVGSVFGLLIGVEFWVRLLSFLAIAAGATGVGVLFFFFSWQGGMKGMTPDYRERVRRFGLRLAFGSLLAMPVLVVLTVATLAPGARSGLVYGLSGAGLLLLFLTAHSIYAFLREGHVRYTAYAFYALAMALIVFMTRDQIAIANAAKEQSARLAVRYERGVEDLKTRLGIALVVLSGKEIYEGKCSACHLFDQKKVGPPYNTVIPKYKGKKAEMIAFVLNPSKVDPAYPSMPSQGLKPAEADSIVTYLLAKYADAAPAPAAAAPSPK
jgi:cytochrome c551/c552